MQCSAGFDCAVLLELHGTKGQAGPFLLDNQDNFRVASLDKFLVRGLDVGEVLAARVWHDGVGTNKTWYLEHVDVCSHSTKSCYEFEAAAILSNTTGMGKVLRPVEYSSEASTKLKVLVACQGFHFESHPPGGFDRHPVGLPCDVMC